LNGADIDAGPERSPPPTVAALNIARNAFHLVLGQVATTTLAVLLNAVLARSLGPADFGLLFLVNSMTWFSFVFVEWGQGSYLVREIAKRREKTSELLGSALVFRVGSAPIICALTLLVAVSLRYDRRTLILAALGFLAWLPISCAQGFGLAFRGRERMDFDATVTVVIKALTVALTLVALRLGGGVLAVILVQIPAALVALVLAVRFSRRLGVTPLRVSVPMLRELALDGTPLVAINLAVFAQPYLDAIVLSKLAPAEVVGWYGGVKLFMNALIMPASILGSATYPRLSVVASDPPQFKQELRGAIRPLFLLGSLASVGTFLFADFAVRLVYGSRHFGPAVIVLKFFAPVLLLFFTDMVLAMAVVAIGKPRQLAIAKFAAVALSTTLDCLLIPVCQARLGNGGAGVVLSFGISELVMLGTAYGLLPRGTFDRRLWVDLARALLAGAGTLLVVLWLPTSLTAIRLPACLLTYTALAFGLKLLRPQDLALLLSALKRRRSGRAGPEISG
jgi:O-antigen/teichoic acid export membrane protein